MALPLQTTAISPARRCSNRARVPGLMMSGGGGRQHTPGSYPRHTCSPLIVISVCVERITVLRSSTVSWSGA
jgi:hypothetical protein